MAKFTHLQILNLGAEPLHVGQLALEPFGTVEVDVQTYASDPDLVAAVHYLVRAGRISVTPTLPAADHPKAA